MNGILLALLVLAEDPAPVAAPPGAPQPTPPADTTAAAPTDAPPSEVAPQVVAPVVEAAAPVVKRPLRIAVQQVRVVGLSDRLEPLFTASLVTEMRKLEGVSVIGMDEVKALLEIESQRQSAGCDESSCLNELAEALGADIVVTAALAEVDGAHLASFRRLDARDGKTAGVDKRFDGGNGEELLSAIGPAVEELFPDASLREGYERGVDKEVGKRLNPPPIQPWMTIAVGAAAGGMLLGAASAGTISALLTSSVQARIDASVKDPVDGAELRRDFDTAQTAALIANILYATGAIAALTAGSMAFFTDFWGYGDDER